jgi:hypothetical protein
MTELLAEPMSQSGATNEKPSTAWVAPAILIGAVILFMGRVCLNYFAYWDDQEFIFKNPHVTSATWSNLGWFWGNSQGMLYIPITMDAFVLLGKLARVPDSSTFENPFDPAYFHTASLLVHVATSLVVFNLLGFLFQRKWAALGGALLFSLHPVQVESLAWTCGFKDLLAGLFSLLAIWQYLLYATAGNEMFVTERFVRPRTHLFVAMAAIVVGELCKPSAMVAPAIALAIDYLLVGRPIRRVVLSVLPLLLIAIPLAVVAKSVQPEATGDGAALLLRPLIATDSLAFYLYKLILPIHLAPDYGRSPHYALSKGWPYWTWVAPILVLVAVLLLRKKYRWLSAAAAVPVIALLPVLGLTSFSFQGISSVADHYLYVAMLGPAIFLAGLFQTPRPRAWVGVTTIVLAALGIRSAFQMGWWRDDITLWQHTIALSPDGVAATVNIASAEARLATQFQGSADKRVEQLKREGAKDDSIQTDRAMVAYRRELNRLATDVERRTRAFIASRSDGKDAYLVFKAKLSLTVALDLLDRKLEAVDLLKGVIAQAYARRDVQPSDLAGAHETLGKLYLWMNDHDSEAAEELQVAVNIADALHAAGEGPTSAGPRASLALARARLASPARKAAVEFALAIQAGDMQKVRARSIGSEEKLQWVQTFSDWAVAYRTYQKASAQRFGADSQIVVSDAQTMVEQVQDAEQKIDGDTAVLTSKRANSQPIRLIKRPDGWKVDLDSLWKDIDTTKSTARVSAMAQTYEQMVHDLDAGKFSSFVESRVELKKRIEIALPPEFQLGPGVKPTTLPSAA